VHLGLKHYFLVDFPQEPGALRRFLDEVLGPNDDITLFEYVKRNNRETGEALVGIELGSAADYEGLRGRMDSSGLHVEALHVGEVAQHLLHGLLELLHLLRTEREPCHARSGVQLLGIHGGSLNPALQPMSRFARRKNLTPGESLL